MMIKPICAIGCFAGTSRFTCRKTPPRGSFRTNCAALVVAMKRDCSHMCRRRRSDAPYDYVADFAFGVASDDRD